MTQGEFIKNIKQLTKEKPRSLDYILLLAFHHQVWLNQPSFTIDTICQWVKLYKFSAVNKQYIRKLLKDNKKHTFLVHHSDISLHRQIVERLSKILPLPSPATLSTPSALLEATQGASIESALRKWIESSTHKVEVKRKDGYLQIIAPFVPEYETQYAPLIALGFKPTKETIRLQTYETVRTGPFQPDLVALVDAHVKAGNYDAAITNTVVHIEDFLRNAIIKAGTVSATGETGDTLANLAYGSAGVLNPPATKANQAKQGAYFIVKGWVAYSRNAWGHKTNIIQEETTLFLHIFSLSSAVYDLVRLSSPV